MSSRSHDCRSDFTRSFRPRTPSPRRVRGRHHDVAHLFNAQKARAPCQRPPHARAGLLRTMFEARGARVAPVCACATLGAPRISLTSLALALALDVDVDVALALTPRLRSGLDRAVAHQRVNRELVLNSIAARRFVDALALPAPSRACRTLFGFDLAARPDIRKSVPPSAPARAADRALHTQLRMSSALGLISCSTARSTQRTASSSVRPSRASTRTAH
jgi:hypothetical protein